MITDSEIEQIAAPFDVRPDRKKRISTVVGFSQNDPLGVGGGIFPDMQTAYFKNGGWLLLSDLMKHYSLANQDKKA